MGFKASVILSLAWLLPCPTYADPSHSTRPSAPLGRPRINALVSASDISGDGSLTLRFLDRIAFSSPARGAVALGEKLLRDKTAPRKSGNVIGTDGKIYRVNFGDRGAVVSTIERARVSVKDVLTPLQAAANLTHQASETKFEAALEVQVTEDEPFHQIRIPAEDGRNIPSQIRDYLTIQLPRHHRAIAKDYEAYTERLSSDRLYSIPVPSSLKKPDVTPQTAGMGLPFR